MTHGLSRSDDLLSSGWLFTSIIIYIMWIYLVTKKEDAEKSILKMKVPRG